MNTIEQLDIILKRLDDCPLNLVRVELEMFRNTLRGDPYLSTVLDELRTSSTAALGERVPTLINDPSSRWLDLAYANSAPLRATAGYQFCECLLNIPETGRCGKRVVVIGETYAALKGNLDKTPAHSVRVSSEIFLHPLVDYLRGALETQHRILLLLSRYRQRSEWFPTRQLLEDASRSDRTLEKRLKIDFLRYLFDNGIDFTVESETPIGGAEVDILPRFTDIGYMPIEVKVFDGGDREAQYITDGLAQAATYARQFNTSRACLLVYNVAGDKRPSLTGSALGPNVIGCNVSGTTVYSTVANVCLTLPASRSRAIKVVNIPLPSENPAS